MQNVNYSSMTDNQQPPSYDSVTQNFLHELLEQDVRPKKSALDLRKIKKVKERAGLVFKTKQQTEKIRKMVIELRTSESQLKAVNVEIAQIDRELTIACDTDNV